MKMKNDKIRELAVEAGLIVEEWDGFNSRSLTPAQEKFAQLIVWECTRFHEKTYLLSESFDKTMVPWLLQDLSKQIRQHFGVEE